MSYQNQKICIAERIAADFFESFINSVHKSLNCALTLDKSINQNLGFMYNEYCQEKKGFVMVSTDDHSSMYWIGLNYNIWSTYNTTKPMLTIWLYNDQNNNIIFEITPLYRWSFKPDEPENPDFITYEEFMKDYQPVIRRVVPRDVAIDWLDQAMQVYRSLFKTEEDFIIACKKLNL